MTPVQAATLVLPLVTQVLVWWAIIRRGRGLWGWWAVGVGLSCFAAAHGLARVEGNTFSATSDVGNALASIGYCALTAGFLGLIRRPSGGGDRRIPRVAMVSELVAVTAAIGVVVVQLSTIPGLGSGRVDHSTMVTYIASDLLLGTVVIQLLIAHPRNRAVWLAITGILLSWTGDITFLAGLDPALAQVFYYGTYPFAVATFWHRDMARIARDGAVRRDETATAWLLAPAALALLGVMAISSSSGDAITLSTLLLSTVSVTAVLVRIGVLVGQVRSASDQLIDLANRDELTGLANRRALLGRLGDIARAENRPSAVLFIDVDRLKALNDAHGHALGDEVLRTISDRLLLVMRAEDLVARYAGDEFVVVVQDVCDAQQGALVRRVEAAIAAPMSTRAGTIAATASVGVVTVTGSETPDELLAAADGAMYARKVRSRDRPVSVEGPTGVVGVDAPA